MPSARHHSVTQFGEDLSRTWRPLGVSESYADYLTLPVPPRSPARGDTPVVAPSRRRRSSARLIRSLPTDTRRARAGAPRYLASTSRGCKAPGASRRTAQTATTSYGSKLPSRSPGGRISAGPCSVTRVLGRERPFACVPRRARRFPMRSYPRWLVSSTSSARSTSRLVSWARKIDQLPGAVAADAGCWNEQHMDEVTTTTTPGAGRTRQGQPRYPEARVLWWAL
jgi:hypothetical protein